MSLPPECTTLVQNFRRTIYLCPLGWAIIAHQAVRLHRRPGPEFARKIYVEIKCESINGYYIGAVIPPICNMGTS